MKTDLRAILLVAAMSVAPAIFASSSEDVFRAVSVDDLRTTRRLLQERPVDRNVVDARSDTLLIVAIRNDASRVFDYLVDVKGIDLDASNGVGETAMMIAAYRKRLDTVEKLIAHGAQVNRPGWTALHYAAAVDARDIVALLLEHSAYIDAESPNRTTPLMMAARSDFGDLCHQLIEAGADPTPMNERDLTASDFARRANDAKLATWLDDQSAAWRTKYGIAVKPGALPRN